MFFGFFRLFLTYVALAFQLAYSYINLLNFVVLYRIMVQTEVKSIGIQCIIDPVRNSESVGEPLCLLEDSFY